LSRSNTPMMRCNTRTRTVMTSEATSGKYSAWDATHNAIPSVHKTAFSSRQFPYPVLADHGHHDFRVGCRIARNVPGVIVDILHQLSHHGRAM
jgi:hypothetical protein